MSSILKALRKLEEEKAALGEEQVDIARDILKGSARRAERQLFWPLTSVVLLIFLLGSVSYLYFFGLQSKGKTAAVHETPPDEPVRQPIVVVKRTPAVVPPTVPDLKSAGTATTTDVVAEKPIAPMAFRPDGSPFVKLTGIAYRDNPQERIAIVNDLPVMQGTFIEGVKVVEIHPHKVVLSWQGQKYTLNVEGE